MRLVAQFGVSPPPKILDNEFKLSKFADEALREQVMNLALATANQQSSQTVQPASKRRKIVKELSTLVFIVQELCSLIDTSPPKDTRGIADLEPQFMSGPFSLPKPAFANQLQCCVSWHERGETMPHP
jgi:hypothetical protein